MPCYSSVSSGPSSVVSDWVNSWIPLRFRGFSPFPGLPHVVSRLLFLLLFSLPVPVMEALAFMHACGLTAS